MPTFHTDEIDIDADDFLSACSPGEIKELINALIDEGHIKETAVLNGSGTASSASEQIFEDHINALHGRRHMLTNEEEETILKITEKFKYL